jgi:hypothetical protein
LIVPHDFGEMPRAEQISALPILDLPRMVGSF